MGLVQETMEYYTRLAKKKQQRWDSLLVRPTPRQIPRLCPRPLERPPPLQLAYEVGPFRHRRLGGIPPPPPPRPTAADAPPRVLLLGRRHAIQTGVVGQRDARVVIEEAIREVDIPRSYELGGRKRGDGGRGERRDRRKKRGGSVVDSKEKTTTTKPEKGINNISDE